ncbi:MAG: indolepyruvate oxidoreductase subunit beta [Caldimicrobium sp.]|nr:indolepyruvate oxidoreductase subunit beta [Caldimicrobium sp.]MCX7873667.1 indolepyruvate oxidoreductase subunit beta [Caldimicrobium sp.]MDW8094358.1 indolepyruvate oxidoreductase subunit beta [Caldimicrobium sp.]
MSKEVVNIILAGTGGQGIVLASRIIAHCALKSGYEVKESEIHGMAQRGGSVIGQVRFGKRVFAPTIPVGEGDLMLALEEMEALRYLHYVNPEGVVILNQKQIVPPALSPEQYPKEVLNRIKAKGYKVLALKAQDIAQRLGSSKVENSVLLGVLSLFLPFELDHWKETIAQAVPSDMIELNLKAFEEGRAFGEKILSS